MGSITVIIFLVSKPFRNKGNTLGPIGPIPISPIDALDSMKLLKLSLANPNI